MPASNKSVQLILPLKERIQFVDRCVSYYDGYEIVVVDASRESHAPLLGKYDNVEYHHRPELSHIGQCALAVSRVSAPYTSIICDDDFTLRSFLEIAVRTLDGKRDAFGVIGHSIRFYEESFELDTKRTANHFRILRAIQQFDDKNVTNGYGFFGKFHFCTFHSALRTDVLIKVIQDFERFPSLNDLNTFDRAFHLLSMMYGQIAVVNMVSHLRSSGMSVHEMLNMNLGGFLHEHLASCRAPLERLGLSREEQDELVENIKATDAARLPRQSKTGDQDGAVARGGVLGGIVSAAQRVSGVLKRNSRSGEQAELKRGLLDLRNWSEAEAILAALKANEPGELCGA